MRPRVRSTKEVPANPWPEERRHASLGRQFPRKPIEERFWAKVEKAAESECWTWRGSVNKHGYGELFSHYRYDTESHYGRVAVPVGAHQLSYRIHKGEVPSGLVVDHICMNKRCVNPSHLRAVTQAVNAIENSNSVPARNKAKTHCKHGHPLAGDNLAVASDGGRTRRYCLTCYPWARKYL